MAHRRPLVNIICSMPTWIYGHFIEELVKYSVFDIRLNECTAPCDILHFLPYYEVPQQVPMLSTAFFSHQETCHQDASLTQRFIDAAKCVNASICMCKKYAKLLNSEGIENVVQMIPGVDLEHFKLRAPGPVAREKLVVGFVGQLYQSTVRKNPELIAKIMDLPFVECRATLGKVAPEDLPAFYADLDLIISPSTVEGGPMAILEGLACGVPTLCYADVGFGDEFNIGVLKVPFGEEGAYLERLESFWNNELNKYREPAMMSAMRAQVEPLSWQHFVKQHDELWANLIDSR